MLYGAPHPVVPVADLRTLRGSNKILTNNLITYHIRRTRIRANIPWVKIQYLPFQPRAVAETKLQSCHTQYPIGRGIYL